MKLLSATPSAPVASPHKSGAPARELLPSRSEASAFEASSESSRISRGGWAVCGLLAILHLAALATFLPPAQWFDHQPLLIGDYPHHWHFADLFAEGVRSGAAPWGYDPRTLPGQWIDPSVDSSRPFELLALALGPTLAVKVMLLLSVLCAPICVFLACRILKFTPDATVWAVTLTLAALWFTDANLFMLRSGMTAFFAACYGSVLAVALFVAWLRKPSPRSYLLFVFTASGVFLLHPFSPALMCVPLVVLTLATPGLSLRVRGASCLAPLGMALLNLWWLVPMLAYALAGSRPEWQRLHPMIVQNNMTYESWSELWEFLSRPHQLLANLATLAFAGAGLWKLSQNAGRLSAVAIGLALAALFGIYWCGSFLPVVKLLQTARFGMPYRLYLLLAAAPAVAALLARCRLPSLPLAGAAAVLLAAGGTATGRLARLPEDPGSSHLIQLLRDGTTSADRIAVQMRDEEDVQALALASWLDREILSTCYPNLRDTAQFTNRPFFPQEMTDQLLGHSLRDWTPDALRARLREYGLSVVVTRSPEWAALLSRVTGEPGRVEGPYTLFRVAPRGTRVTIGQAQVNFSPNRLRVTNIQPVDGRLVLAWRYHPGWRSETGEPVTCAPLAGDPYGFLEIRDPPASLSLVFDAQESLFAAWPAAPAAGVPPAASVQAPSPHRDSP